MLIEIEGDPNQPKTWQGLTGCPSTGEVTKSIFCPFRDECELLRINVRAEDNREAKIFTEYATAAGEIPNCLNGKPYLTKMFRGTISFQPHSID